MRSPVIARFGFRIRTRKGILVDVILPGRDELDAERKLHQIYRECEVVFRGFAQPSDNAPNFAELHSHALR